MAKQLRTDLSGKPQSRQAMKLAKIGFQIGAGQNAVRDLAAVHQQHAAVPHLGPLDTQLREMRVDLLAALKREWPCGRLEAQIEPPNRNDRDVVHPRGGRRESRVGQASIVPLADDAAPPPIEAPVNLRR